MSLGSVYNAQEIEAYIENQMNVRFAGNQAVMDERLERAGTIIGQCADRVKGMDVKVAEIIAHIEDAHTRIAERIDETNAINAKVDSLYTETDTQLKQTNTNLQQLDISNKAALEVLMNQLK